MPRFSKSYQTVLRGMTDSTKVNGVSIAAEMLFVRLLLVSDDFGRYYGDPFDIAGRALTVRWRLGQVSPEVVADLLSELEAADLIRRYEVAGEAYVEVVDYEDATPTDRRKPRFPTPPGPRPQTGDTVSPNRGRDVPKPPPRARAPQPQPQPQQQQPQPAARAAVVGDQVQVSGGPTTASDLAAMLDPPVAYEEADPPEPRAAPPRTPMPAWVDQASLAERIQDCERVASTSGALTGQPVWIRVAAWRQVIAQCSRPPERGDGEDSFGRVTSDPRDPMPDVRTWIRDLASKADGWTSAYLRGALARGLYEHRWRDPTLDRFRAKETARA